jgi:8-oxo-dGTP diphosphatase
MDDIKNKIVEAFGHRLRVRVCGLCIENGKVLLVNHHSLNENGDFWGPPGGGMDYGMSAEENLKREFLEETGIHIEVDRFLFVHEYLSPPLHAIELIFLVRRLEGEINIGFDPEMKHDEQIIKDVRFMEFEDIWKLEHGMIHQLFENFTSEKELRNSGGYFRWINRV